MSTLLCIGPANTAILFQASFKTQIKTSFFNALCIFFKPTLISGCNNCVADSTIVDMHDRRNQLTLKKFLSENVSVANKPKVETRTQNEEGSTSTLYDFNWQKPTTLSQVQEAVHNFCSILHWLYPWDPSGLMLLRLMSKYRWIMAAQHDDKNRVELIKTYFNLVMKKLAASATNGKVIPSYKELEELLKTTLSQNGISSDLPTNKAIRNSNSNNFNSKAATRNYSDQPKTYGEYSGGNRTRQKQRRNDNWANVDGYGLCWDWNSVDGRNCTRKRRKIGSHNGCEGDNDQKFIHLCNAYNEQKQTFCYGNHPQKQHR